jgi:hypothetical protein
MLKTVPRLGVHMRIWCKMAVIACLSLVGCGGPRPEKGAICTAPQQSLIAAAVLAPPSTLRNVQSRQASGPAGVSDLEVDPSNNVFVADLLDSISYGTGPYHVLAVSAGGQWGAYGAGVLAGMDFVQQVPDFRLVTGISTGAMLAPLMFLGEYKVAKDLYTNLTNDSVFRSRSYFELITANSLVDTSPLRQKVREILKPDLIEKIKHENVDRHRVLAVQAVDLDAGTSIVFDLTAIAAEKYHPCGDQVSPTDCIIHAIMAAAAIPVAFPPEFIGGDMYVDGGLRQHAFSLKLAQKTLRQPKALQAQMSISPGRMLVQLGGTPEPGTRPIDLILIANTDFVVNPQCVGNGLLEVAGRSAGIGIDQLSIGSFYRLMAETLEQNGDTARFTYADPKLTNCKRTAPSSSSSVVDAFDTDYMRCLFKAACILASGGGDIWHTQPDDLPQSPIASVAPRQGLGPQAKPNVPAICEVPG